MITVTVNNIMSNKIGRRKFNQIQEGVLELPTSNLSLEFSGKLSANPQHH